MSHGAAGVSKSTVSLVLGGKFTRCGFNSERRVTQGDSERTPLRLPSGAATSFGAQNRVFLGTVINDLSEPLSTLSSVIGIEQAHARAARSSRFSQILPRILSASKKSSGLCVEHLALGWCSPPLIGSSLKDTKPLVAGLPRVVQVMPSASRPEALAGRAREPGGCAESAIRLSD